MRRVPVIAVVLVVAGLAARTALPETAVAPVVAERQASMKAMASAAKTISGIFDGKLAYDAAAFKAAVETIRRRSGIAMVDAFPTGSFGASAANAKIEQSREEFAALARHLESLAAALSDAADDAPDGITEAMRMKSGMAMGSSLLGKRAGGKADADPSKMPAEHMFHLMLQDCTNCHAKFREKRR
ncbi:MAG: cytochrome c [Mesorhizobium sp.]|uniref:cytochrome c n=1 Tax=unclassified Mesorhizobium TaxID=325217 RepID=UPI000FCB54DB|nr:MULTISPECIES: cytochrome c [unclassified Mesorhizobium]RUV73202.1 cytochrome c [Mesorhizobium sp. M5C.F.Cr.IN.023.01.1.1]RWF87379.1 MAG: cytochrome c [Mesorhizobium sp.]RWF91728.1 MAG: cytochrome c [Mesorhizobium sp.]RWI33739.1 MAG: cytochrome c [Mesorhizobium sp.]RWI44756.1 MAG: cytochrome c [Mesorhizobium sp.]